MCGNICEITTNGKLSVRYEYDSINRLIREDNNTFGNTYLLEYDNCGNILSKKEYAYTLGSVEDKEPLTEAEYTYEGDKLKSYNGASIKYNGLGSPTTYRNKTLTWKYGKQLVNYNGTTFTYDGLGRRTSKGSIEFIYDNNGNLVKQSDGLEFVYDNSGVAGIIYNGVQYFYRKDIQGNIIAILDNTGNVVVEYKYDAWGNHAILDSNGNDVTSGIGILNPFRYRGYYYDTETELYYLQSRYYDPETGRFISQDSIDYADPETINGLNLYAYCGNNPVMNVDPSGTVFLAIFLTSLIVGGVVGAVTGGIKSASNGGSFWKGALIGGLTGLVVGGAFGLGAGIALTSTSLLMGLGGLALTAAGSFAAGMGIYALDTKINGIDFSFKDMVLHGFNLAVKASANYGLGYLFGAKGMFKQSAKLNLSSPKMFFKSLFFKNKYLLSNMLERSYLKFGTVTLFSFFTDSLFKEFYGK